MLEKRVLSEKRKTNWIGWGGRIRTFTVLINSEVSYQLDHAPTSNDINTRYKDLADERTHARLSHDCAGASFGASWGFCWDFDKPFYGGQGMLRRKV